MRLIDQIDGYSGETVDELLALPAKHQYDALVRAFEEAIQQKATAKGEGALSEEERTVLAVRAVDREVGNGGYHQFFSNSSRKFAPMIVDALVRVGCKTAAKLSQRAVDALRLSSLTVQQIRVAMSVPNKERDKELDRCDQLFYGSPQGISRRLYAFIKANRGRISLS